VTITAAVPASTAGSDDASGTLRIHMDNFSLYNVNVKNTYGEGSQALAVSMEGTKAGFYGTGLYGYQDTLLTNEGVAVYLNGFIEVRHCCVILPYLLNRIFRGVPTSSSVNEARRTSRVTR
jgi:pectinesterase